MRRSIVVGATLFVLAVVLIGGPSLFSPPTTSEIAPDSVTDDDPDIVYPTDGESGFWPYLNSRQSFEQRSPINVVVIAETDTVVRLLRETGEGGWVETDEEEKEADPGTHAILGENESGSTENPRVETNEFIATNIVWTRTTGATRYAYVDPGAGEEPRWVEETAQVHDGTYYGHRYHIRMYESPDPREQWVAMQTHHEHFDWFTLRHRVDGSQAAQERLERDFMALPGIDVQQDVRRVYLGNENAGDADGWATFVNIVGLTAVGFFVTRSRPSVLGKLSDSNPEGILRSARQHSETARVRIDRAHLLLAGAIVGIVIGVRAAGVGLEGTDLLSMHSVAVVLYPFVGVGLPVATYLFASRIESRLQAAVVGGGALALAFWLDYGWLGIHTLPIDVVIQRIFVVIALGLIAGGASRRASRVSRWNGMLISGTLLWTLLLVATLFGYV